MARLGEGALHRLCPAGQGAVAGSRRCPQGFGDRTKAPGTATAPLCPQVRCWRHDEKEENAKRIRTVGNQTSTRVSNLRGNALYHLAVRAYNTAGIGPSSAAVNVTTKKPRECGQGCPAQPRTDPLSRSPAPLSLEELSDFSQPGFCVDSPGSAFFI